MRVTIVGKERGGAGTKKVPISRKTKREHLGGRVHMQSDATWRANSRARRPGGCARFHVGAGGLLAADGPTLGAAATYARHGTHGEEGACEVPVLARLRLLRSAASADRDGAPGGRP